MALSLRRARGYILTDEDIQEIDKDVEALAIPKDMIAYNQGLSTSFSEEDNLVYVRGNIFPDPYGTSARDRMSTRAILAHEYYGHCLNAPSEYPIGDWRDEFRASRDAALHAPNLSPEERRDLMVDAFDRAREAGVILRPSLEDRRIIYGL